MHFNKNMEIDVIVEVIVAVVERIVMDWFDENSSGAKPLVFVLTLTRLPWLYQHLSILLLFALPCSEAGGGKIIEFHWNTSALIACLFNFILTWNKLRSHYSPISHYHIHLRVSTNIKYWNVAGMFIRILIFPLW